MSQRGQATALISIGLVGVVLVLGFIVLSAVLGYWLEPVGSTQVGIQFQGNKPVNIVGPGIYTDLSPFADITRVETKDLPFMVTDPEVLTQDQQRIGVTASGTVRRPGMEKADVLLADWGRYSIFYKDDGALVGVPANEKDKIVAKDGLMQALGNQAVKVCVGDLVFSKAVIGSARDTLRECIAKELNDLAAGYGLSVSNIVVPNVTLSADVQKAMDNITNARFAEQVARQNEQTAKATADQALAVAAGSIRVEQGKVQETARQAALTADLSKSQLEAERKVIEQQKANDLFAAQQELAIQQAKSASQAEAAKAANAATANLAWIYQQNPVYADYQNKQAIAAGWKATDKVYVGPGVDPVIVIGGGTQPVIQTPAR